MIARFLALCCLIAIFPALALANGDQPEEKIAAAAERWSALYQARDLDGLMALYHSDAKLFTNGTPALVGRGAIKAYFAQAFAQTQSGQIDFKIEDIRVFGDVATIVSLYKMEIDAGKAAPVVVAGRSMLVYKRGAYGHWLLFADMDNKAPDATFQAFDAAP